VNDASRLGLTAAAPGDRPRPLQSAKAISTLVRQLYRATPGVYPTGSWSRSMPPARRTTSMWRGVCCGASAAPLSGVSTSPCMALGRIVPGLPQYRHLASVDKPSAGRWSSDWCHGGGSSSCRTRLLESRRWPIRWKPHSDVPSPSLVVCFAERASTDGQ
jgi:hypothetical protein